MFTGNYSPEVNLGNALDDQRHWSGDELRWESVVGNDRTDADVDVLVMTMDRPTEPATTPAGLAGQQHDGFRVLVSDQSFDPPAAHATARVLDFGGRTAVLEEFR